MRIKWPTWDFNKISSSTINLTVEYGRTFSSILFSFPTFFFLNCLIQWLGPPLSSSCCHLNYLFLFENKNYWVYYYCFVGSFVILCGDYWSVFVVYNLWVVLVPYPWKGTWINKLMSWISWGLYYTRIFQAGFNILCNCIILILEPK